MKGFNLTISISDSQHYNAVSRLLFIMLNVIMLSVVTLSVEELLLVLHNNSMLSTSSFTLLTSCVRLRITKVRPWVAQVGSKRAVLKIVCNHKYQT